MSFIVSLIICLIIISIEYFFCFFLCFKTILFKTGMFFKSLNLNKFDFKSIYLGDSGILGRGGMTTKIKAARDFLNKTNEVWILNGNQKGIVEKVILKKPLGTKIYLA